MKKIRLQLWGGYFEEPIMVQKDDEMHHIDVCELPISDRLKVDLSIWDTEYQCTLNHNDPVNSRFSTKIVEQDHAERGAKMAKRLQSELGSSYIVEYRPLSEVVAYRSRST